MKASRRRFLALAGGAVAAPALLRKGHAQAPQVTLKMHHFLPPVSNGHAKFLAPWAKKVEADSQGRIKIDIFLRRRAPRRRQRESHPGAL